jgi:hypothetical protein
MQQFVIPLRFTAVNHHIAEATRWGPHIEHCLVDVASFLGVTKGGKNGRPQIGVSALNRCIIYP